MSGNLSPTNGWRLVPVTLALFAATSCDDDDDPLEADVDVVGIEILTDDPQVAHELEFATTIKATRPAEDVKIDYFLMSNEDDVAANVAPEQYRLGTVVYPVVEESASGLDYTSRLIVPAAVAEVDTEEFLLFAHVDPGGELAERNEANNYPQEAPVRLVLDDTQRDRPDLVVKSLSFDSHTIFLEDHDAAEDPDRIVNGIKDEENHHVGVTVELEAAGALPVTDVDLTFWVEIPGTNNPAATAVGLPADHWRLEAWDHDQVDADEGGTGEYEDEYIVGTIQPGDTHSVHLDLLIPTGDADENDVGSTEPDVHGLLMTAVAAGDSHFEVKVVADDDGSLSEYESSDANTVDFDDNQLSDELVMLEPDPEAVKGIQLEGMTVEALEKQLDWSKDWSNDHFGVGLELDSLSRVDGRGARASAETKVPATLFGSEFDLLDLESSAWYVPFDREDSGFQFDFRFAGLTIYTHTGELPEIVDWEWNNSNSWPKSKSVGSTFTVGIVPLRVDANVMVTLGYDISAHLGSSFRLDADAFADASASAQAEATIGILEAGVVGELVLVNDTFKASSFAGVDYDELNDQVLAGLYATATNDLVGPSGRIALFAEWSGLKWCKRLGIPYPCGRQNHRKEKPLAKWEPYEKRDVLLDFNEQSTGSPPEPYRFDAIRD